MGFNIVSKRANVFENGAGFFAFCCKRHAEALFECKAKFKRINAVKAESLAKERFIGINIFGLDVFERERLYDKVLQFADKGIVHGWIDSLKVNDSAAGKRSLDRGCASLTNVGKAPGRRHW